MGFWKYGFVFWQKVLGDIGLGDIIMEIRDKVIKMDDII